MQLGFVEKGFTRIIQSRLQHEVKIIPRNRSRNYWLSRPMHEAWRGLSYEEFSQLGYVRGTAFFGNIRLDEKEAARGNHFESGTWASGLGWAVLPGFSGTGRKLNLRLL